MAFRKIFLFVNPDLAALVPSDSPSTQLGLISKLPVYYFGETVIFCISLVDSQGNAVPYLNSDTFEMSVDNNFMHNDDLMAHTEGKADGTDSKVNVPGDWAAVSAANGKLSVRVDFNTVSYETKIGGSEFIQVRTEIKKFDAGSEDPAILMQSISTARNVVNGGEGEPEEADPNYLTAAQTRALAAAEAGNLWKSGSGTPTYTDENPGDMYLDTTSGDVYQVQVMGGVAGYVLVGNFMGPPGAMPVISGGSATSLSPGSNPSVEVVSSGGSTYILNLGIPAGEKGEPGQNGSLTVPIQPYSSDSAYNALTCITYNGGGYQVVSATNAGETPDSDPSKFVCFASPGSTGSSGTDGISPTLTVSATGSGVQIITSDAQGTSSGFVSNGEAGSSGISPTCSVTQTSSGAIVYTSDAHGASSAVILHGKLEGASELVTSLTSGGIVLEHEAVPVYVRTSAGNMYPIEKGTITISSGAWVIDPAAYLAYDGVSAFAGPWTVFYAGGLPDFQLIHSGGSAIVPTEHQVYQIPLSSGTSITVDSSGLTSAVCMTAELWLDMPSTAVSFSLPGFTWIDGSSPDFTSANTRYAVTVRWDGDAFLANLAYSRSLV